MTETDHAAAFAALADPTRVAILRALWEADEHRASFSTLREAAGVADSGKFNYHLDQLTDGFLAKTDDGEYRLRRAGLDVVGSVIAGVYDHDESVGPTPYDEPCPFCGGDTTLSYDGESLTVRCPDPDTTEETIVSVPAPPSVFSGSLDPVEAARRYTRSMVETVRSGFCLFCETPATKRIVPNRRITDTTKHHGSNPLLQSDCQACGESINVDLGVALTAHPSVVAFHHDRGIDTRRLPVLDTLAAADGDSTVVSEDPVRARVRYVADGDTLTLRVDESGSVLETTIQTA